MQKMSRLDLLEMIKDMTEELKMKEYELKRCQEDSRSEDKSAAEAPIRKSKELWEEMLSEYQNLRNQGSKNEQELAQCLTKYDELSEQMEKMVKLQHLMMELQQTQMQSSAKPAMPPPTSAAAQTHEPFQTAARQSAEPRTVTKPLFQSPVAQQSARSTAEDSAAESRALMQRTQEAANEYLQALYSLRPEAESEARQIVYEAQNRADEIMTQAERRLTETKEQINSLLRTAQLVQQQLSRALDGTAK